MVGRVVRDIHREAPGFDVLVVDDGSTDATAAEAEAEGAMVIRHPYNLGIGGAVQSGYKYALRHDYDVAVQVDGDGQHKPEYLPRDARGAADRRRRGRHGLRQPLPRRPRLQGPVRPPARQHDLLGRAHRAHPPEDHRPDLGLSDDQPPRDRALRPRLPARLPRGRGAADAPRPPPAHPRGPRADERARLRRRARSTTRAAPTTWSRCCWRCSSASSAAARPRSRRPARTSRASARRRRT